MFLFIHYNPNYLSPKCFYSYIIKKSSPECNVLLQPIRTTILLTTSLTQSCPLTIPGLPHPIDSTDQWAWNGRRCDECDRHVNIVFAHLLVWKVQPWRYVSLWLRYSNQFMNPSFTGHVTRSDTIPLNGPKMRGLGFERRLRRVGLLGKFEYLRLSQISGGSVQIVSCHDIM
jgi:hypothetical protein